MPDVNGVWKPLTGTDDRLLTIKHLKDSITIEGPDLSCTLTDLQIDEGSSVTANSECSDESFTIYAKETLTALPIDQEVFLVNATVTLRLENENSDPKIHESHTNEPATVRVYQRVRKLDDANE